MMQSCIIQIIMQLYIYELDENIKKRSRLESLTFHITVHWLIRPTGSHIRITPVT